MSLRCTLIIQQNLNSYVLSGCLVPFLYHTRTILSHPLQARSCQTSRTSGTGSRAFSSYSGRPYESFDYEARKSRPHYKDNPSTNRRFNRPSDFELPFEDAASRDKVESRTKQEKRSTITASEKAVFARILQNIERMPRKEPQQEEDALEDELDDEHDPQQDLSAIFDAAIRDLRVQEELARAGAERSQQISATVPARERAVDVLVGRKDEPPGAMPFRRPLKLANGMVLGDEMQSEEDLDRLKKACDDHRGLISSMFESATSDVEIWRILEKEVFKLVGDLNTQTEARKKARKEVDRKVESAEIDGKSKREKQVRSKNQPKVKNLTQESIALPTDTLYSILSTNYADYLLSALRLLRRHHPTSSYALYLLPTIRRLGPISYVLGASTGFFNEIFFLRWTQYSDLHGIADLLQEMLDQGIEINSVTTNLLVQLKMDRRAGLKGRKGPVVQKWWKLRGTDEGWKRIVGLDLVIQNEEIQAIARKAGEKEEQREEEREEYERIKLRLKEDSGGQYEDVGAHSVV